MRRTSLCSLNCLSTLAFALGQCLEINVYSTVIDIDTAGLFFMLPCTYLLLYLSMYLL